MDAESGIIDEIRACLDDGADLSGVGSTDDRLVLELTDDDHRQRFRLDAEATRDLMKAGLIERLTQAEHPATPAIV